MNELKIWGVIISREGRRIFFEMISHKVSRNNEVFESTGNSLGYNC